MSKKKTETLADSSSVLKDIHEQKIQAIRVVDANREVPTDYDNVDLTYNIDGSVTKASFYGNRTPQVTNIRFIGDVAGSLNSKYFFINSGANVYQLYVWYNKDGTGVDPAIAGRIGVEIEYNEGDSATVIAAVTELILSRLSYFQVSRNGYNLRIENLQFGETTQATTETSGFTITTPEIGISDLLKVITLPYTNGVKYVYNLAERKFDLLNGTFTGTFSPSGLKNGGKVTEVDIDDTTWTAIPGTALTLRNALSIQNRTGVECKINYDNAVVGYVGIVIPDAGERFYDITDDIVVYAKAAPGSGTVTLFIEELS